MAWLLIECHTDNDSMGALRRCQGVREIKDSVEIFVGFEDVQSADDPDVFVVNYPMALTDPDDQIVIIKSREELDVWAETMGFSSWAVHEKEIN